MMLLRWCSRKAEQSFLLAIFFRSDFFSNSTGSLSGSFTISQSAGFFWKVLSPLAVEVRKNLFLQVRPNIVLPLLRFFFKSSIMPQPWFSNLPSFLLMSYTPSSQGGEKLCPLLRKVSGLAMKSFSSLLVLNTQILRLQRPICSQFLRQSLTYSRLILQLIGQKLPYSDRLCKMQLQLSPTCDTSDAPRHTRSFRKTRLALTRLSIQLRLCSSTPHFDSPASTVLTLLYLLTQQVYTSTRQSRLEPSRLWITSMSQLYSSLFYFCLASTLFLTCSSLMRRQMTAVGTMPLRLSNSHCLLLAGSPSRIQPLEQSARVVLFSIRLTSASSVSTFPFFKSLTIPLMSESSCSITNSSIISCRLMTLKPYLSLRLWARVVLPDLVLPMMNTTGTDLTSLGTGWFCSRILGFLITCSLSSSSLRQQILSLQMSGYGLGTSISEKGFSLPNLLSSAMWWFRKSLTLNLSMGSMLLRSHLVALSSMHCLMRQLILSVTCLASRSHLMLITYTPRPLKAQVYSQILPRSAQRWALRDYYFWAIIYQSLGISGSYSSSAGSLYSSPAYIAFCRASSFSFSFSILLFSLISSNSLSMAFLSSTLSSHFCSSLVSITTTSGSLLASPSSSTMLVDTLSSSTSQKLPLMKISLIPPNMPFSTSISLAFLSKSPAYSNNSASSTCLPSSSNYGFLKPLPQQRSVFRLFFSFSNCCSRVSFRARMGILYFSLSFSSCVLSPTPRIPMNMILGGTAGLVFCRYLEGSVLKSFSSFSPLNRNLRPWMPASNSSLPLMSHPCCSATGQYSPQKPIGIGSPSSCLSAHTLLVASSSALRQKGSMICLILTTISSGVLSMKSSLQTSSPSASLTGPMLVLQVPTCSIYASVSRVDRILFGFSSVLSDRMISLSMGMLYCLSALSCYSLLGQPMMMQPLISSSLPMKFISGITSLRDRSSGGGVFGRYSSAFLSFFLVFFGTGFLSSTSGGVSPSQLRSMPQPAGFFCRFTPIWCRIMGRTSLALSSPPLQKSFHSPYDRWMELTRLSKLEGTCDSNCFCLTMIDSRISWMLSTGSPQISPSMLAMVFLPDLRGPEMQMLVALGSSGSLCRYFLGRLRKEFWLFSFSKTKTRPAYSAANSNLPAISLPLSSSTQSIRPQGLHFLNTFSSSSPTPSSSFSLPSSFLGRGIGQREWASRARHSYVLMKLFWSLM